MISCLDHFGVEYNSINEMCRHYNISSETFSYRIKSGWSLQEALEGRKVIRTKPSRDHLGTIYNSLEEMCTHWE